MFDLELAEVMQALRQEIAEAQSAANDQKLKFQLTNLELEFQLLVTKKAEGRAGISFWLVDAATKADVSSASTQRIKFTMVALDAENKPIDVSSRR